MQDLLLRNISEVHMIHHESSGQWPVLNTAIRLMRMFPRPLSGPLHGLHDLPVRAFPAANQRYIAIVLLRLFIQKRKDPVRAGQSHYDRVQLLRHLVDRHGK